MSSTIFNFLLITGAIHGFIFNIATLLSLKKVEKTIVFLNLVVFLLSLNNLQAWLIDNGFSSSMYYIKHLLVPWYMLILPMFYVFLLHYLRISEKLWPFLVISLILFSVELISRSGVIAYSYYWGDPSDTSLISSYNNIEEIVNAGYSIFIFIKASLVLFKYEKLYEYILQFDDILWIKRFMYLGGFVIFFWIIAILLNNFTQLIKAPYSYYPLRLCSSILLYWIGYQGFFRYVVVNDRILLRQSLHKLDGSKPKVPVTKEDLGKTKLDESGNKQTQQFNRINDYVENNERFLDSILSLDTLAQELDMSSSQLSTYINNCTPYNFSDYINNFRVNQAKRLLGNSEFDQYTIVAIGLECGFNSKSTFYSAFKKFTKQTPTEYRRLTSS